MVECFEGISHCVGKSSQANMTVLKNLELQKSIVTKAKSMNDNYYFDVVVNMFDSILMAGDDLQPQILESGIFDFFSDIL